MDTDAYDQLPSRAARARYLLTQPLTAKPDNPAPDEARYRARAADWLLPVTGHSEAGTLAKAKAWLLHMAEEDAEEDTHEPPPNAPR